MTLDLNAKTISSQDRETTTAVSHRFPGETWVEASWSDFLQATEQSDYSKGKFYYYQDHLRIEMSPLGNAHANDQSTIIGAIHLYIAVNNFRLMLKDNCSYRKTGHKEAQPDISCYIGDELQAIPFETGVIDLDQFSPPALVVEVANSSLMDDQGVKRLLYEELGIQEYWIVNVKAGDIMAFKIENQGSYRIHKSQVIPDLDLSIIEAALQMTRKADHGEVMNWLLRTFTQKQELDD